MNNYVQLNSGEQLVCKSISNERFMANRKSGVKNARVGDQSNQFTDLEGFAGELAFCKMYNVFPDFSIEPRTVETDRGDVILPSGATVDVKTTKYPNGRLLAVSWKKRNGDLFALMTGVFPKYTFVGFMPQNKLLDEKRIGNLGHGLTYIAEQHELTLEEAIN